VCFPEERVSNLAIAAGWDDQAILVLPEDLGLPEVNTMLPLIVITLPWVILELHGIYSIPSSPCHRKDYFLPNVPSDLSLLAFGIPPAREAESGGGIPKVPKGQGLGRLAR